MARRVPQVCTHIYHGLSPCRASCCRLFMKGARNLEFEKLREICGDYQQLNYAKGALRSSIAAR